MLVIGDGFHVAGTTTVRFGTRDATQVAVHSTRSLSCLAPAGVTTGPVVVAVVNPDLSTLSIPAAYSYTATVTPQTARTFTSYAGYYGFGGPDGPTGIRSASWVDLDRDGDLDVFLARVNGEEDLFFRNDGGVFSRQSVRALDLIGTRLNLTRSSAFGDFDGDGRDDLYLGANRGVYAGAPGVSADFLYRRTSRGFQYVGPLVGVEPDGSACEGGASWRDYDRDGDLDLFVPNTDGQQDFLFRNEGGRFTRVDSVLGLGDALSSVGSAWGDFDGDGDDDLYVAANDGAPPRLYRNDGTGFVSVATALGVTGTSPYSSGAAWADVDGDGDLDLFVANVGVDSFLYRNEGGAFLRGEVSAGLAGLNQADTCAFADYDADGDPDLLVGAAPFEPVRLFRNDGGTFTRVDSQLGLRPRNIGKLRAACWADMDDDGDLDFILPGDDVAPMVAYRNDGFGGNFLTIRCVTDADGDATDDFPFDDREALGAMIEVDRDGTPDWNYSFGTVARQYVDSVTGRASGNTPWPLFGLGGATIAHVRVTFVDGTVVAFPHVGANQRIMIRDR